MLFDEMINMARNIVAQQGGRMGYNDTICIARTVSGKVVAGISSSMMMNNMPMNVHAEVDLCNKLAADADTAVAELTLLSASGFAPVLPCGECIGRLISLHPYNSNTMLVLPDTTMPLGQVMMQNPAMQPNMGMGGYAGAPMGNQMGGYPQPAPYRPADQQSLSLEQLQGMSPMPASALNLSRPVSAYLNEKDESDSGLLKKRLSSVLDTGLDDDDDEEEKAPKKKFRLFGGKKEK